jgi:hypothetical protein
MMTHDPAAAGDRIGRLAEGSAWRAVQVAEEMGMLVLQFVSRARLEGMSRALPGYDWTAGETRGVSFPRQRPAPVFVAPGVEDSTLIHELAHVLGNGEWTEIDVHRFVEAFMAHRPVIVAAGPYDAGWVRM